MPHTLADTVGDLAAALDLPRDSTLVIGGRRGATHETLAAAGARAGSAIGTADRPRVPRPAGVVEVVVTTGPSCATAVSLPPGRHIVGRSASADVVVDDPLVELHHGVLVVDESAAVTFRQLTGSTPATIGTVVCDGPMPVPQGAVVSLGSSGLVIRADGAFALEAPVGRLIPSVEDPWRRVVQRGPGVSVPDDPPPLRRPERADVEPMPPATGLIAAGVAVVAATAVAFAMGQMMFALFAGIGAVASITTWAVGVGGVVRRRRRRRRTEREEWSVFAVAIDDARRSARTAHTRRNPTIEHALFALDALDSPDGGLVATDVWRRRCGGQAPLRAVLGHGTRRWRPPMREFDAGDDAAYEFDCDLGDVPVAVDLPAASAFALRGSDEWTRGLVRSVVIQLATHYGPADLQIVVVTRTPREWAWIAWLPHARSRSVIDAADTAALVEGLSPDAAEAGRQLVLVVDDLDLFAVRTGVLRRFVDVAAPCTIALAGAGEPVPALCDRVLDVSVTGTARWERGGGDDGGRVRPSGVAVATAERAARRLAGLADPEDEVNSTATLRSVVTLSDVDPVLAPPAGGNGWAAGAATGPADHRDPAATVAHRWVTAGADPPPVAALGMSADGLVEVDLVHDGPHALVAGTTGAGKSELLRTLVVGLALRLGPDHLTFVLVDYKGGSTFDACTDLPHTVGLVTDLDAGSAERALVSLEAELHRRERLLRAVGAADLTDYRARPGCPPLPRLVVVIDEFAALAKDLPDFLAALVGVAQRGRSLGLHLVLATQRPAGVVNDDIRANTNLRIALRLAGAVDASDVVDDALPAQFPRGVPGRAALRLGPGELVTFQTASCTGPADGASASRLRVVPADDFGPAVTAPTPCGDEHDGGQTSQLAAAVTAIGDAARALGTRPPHRPWIDALPTQLTAADVMRDAPGCADGAIGLVDDPAAQCRRLLRWDGGNLALVGGTGTGRTATLVALMVSRCRISGPDRLHCYVIDSRGDPALGAVADLAQCGGVIGAVDGERLHRLLTRLAARIDERSMGSAHDDLEVVLAVDGLGSLRALLSTADRASTLALLDRVLADGAAAGVATCWTDDVSAAGVASHADEIWSFGDTGASSESGTRTAVPGRLRVGSSGLWAQVAADAGATAGLGRRRPDCGPPPVDRLPERVRATTVMATRDRSGPSRATGAVLELPIGVADDGLGIATLRVPPADHVFVGGGALTGKTTALIQLSNAWRGLHPDGVQLFVTRHDPLTPQRLDAGVPGPVLVVVDDADRVDDVGGTLASILAGECSGVTIAAAARVDAVRASYGHWTRDVARSRCGVILTAAGEVDGDLLGVMLPRRALIAPRPGLGWLVDSRGHRLVQVAQADVEFAGTTSGG